MNSWMRMRDMVNRIYEIGKKCGLEKDIIRNDIQNFSNRLISERLLRNLLPAELKHSKSTKNRVETISTSSTESAQKNNGRGLRDIHLLNHPEDAKVAKLDEITTVVVLKASAKYRMQRTTCVQCGKVLA